MKAFGIFFFSFQSISLICMHFVALLHAAYTECKASWSLLINET